MGVIRIRDQKIERLFFKELTEKERARVYDIKRGDNAGKSIAILKDKTHKLNMQMEDEVWYDVGHVSIKDDYPVAWRKNVDDEWITINEGAVICFKAKENSWKDKTTGETVQGNSKVMLDSFDLIENGEENKNPFIYNQSGEQTKGREADSKGQKKWTKKDTSGISVGHSLNCGLIHTKYKLDVTKVLKASENAHDITLELQEEYKELHPKMSEYDRNAAVGHAILNAFRIGGSKLTLLNNARIILNDLVPPMFDYVKGIKKEVEPDKEETKKEPEPDKQKVDEKDAPW